MALDRSLFAASALQPSTVYNYRTFPLYYGRQDGTDNLNASILKYFALGERLRMQYRFEAYNVLNHTQFGAPSVSSPSNLTAGSFGVISSQQNTPRTLQQGLRLVF